jgi:hypothetical protein
VTPGREAEIRKGSPWAEELGGELDRARVELKSFELLKQHHEHHHEEETLLRGRIALLERDRDQLKKDNVRLEQLLNRAHEDRADRSALLDACELGADVLRRAFVLDMVQEFLAEDAGVEDVMRAAIKRARGRR